MPNVKDKITINGQIKDLFMKKLAITISAILASGAAYAGNEATTELQFAYGDDVQITQNTSHANPALGNDAFVYMTNTYKNDTVILQTGNENTATVDATHASRSQFDITQTGNENTATIETEGALNRYNDLRAGSHFVNRYDLIAPNPYLHSHFEHN